MATDTRGRPIYAPLVEMAPERPGQVFIARGGFYARYGKRALDLVVAIPLLVIAAPIILLAAAAVVLTSGWPPFYAAERVGKDGRPFRMWKVRTMRRDADETLAAWRTTHPELFRLYERDFKLREDPRVTLAGRILRRSSLDELPQLWNVIRGEMSLVGPRPYMWHELAEAPESVGSIASVCPGLTGPWQVRGRNSIDPRGRMLLDEEYALQNSFRNDIELLVRTLPLVVRWNGV